MVDGARTEQRLLDDCFGSSGGDGLLRNENNGLYDYNMRTAAQTVVTRIWYLSLTLVVILHARRNVAIGRGHEVTGEDLYRCKQHQ